MLSIENLSTSFLNRVSLKLNQGDFCIVIGSNGSGKSTLLRCLSNEIDIFGGRILINGCDMTFQNRSRAITLLDQDTNKSIVPDLSLLKNIVLSQNRFKRASLQFFRRHQPKIISLLTQFNPSLLPVLHQPLKFLSGGQKQTVATLMAFLSQTRILLLDEHTAALDPHSHHNLMNFTEKNIIERNLTTMMVTHRLEDAITYGNRLVMLHQGNVVLNLSSDEKKKLTVNTLREYYHAL